MGSDEKYLGMFSRLFRNENRMSSTYKPVFMRAILDVGDMYSDGLIGREWLEERGRRLRVDLNFVAARFSKYYWDMEYGFRLRQSQDPHDANILRLIKDERRDGQKPPSLARLAGGRMSDFRKRVIAESIRREVLVHLHTDVGDMYEEAGAGTIEFDLDIVDFLSRHKTVLRKGLNNMIVKYLEKMNRFTPKIANKVDMELGYRRHLENKSKERLEDHQDCRCFYCTRRIEKYHVDHVIPHNYVFSTDVYNCVLACRQCNCKKSDRLPEKSAFKLVLERNDDLADHMRSVNSRYDSDSYSRLFESCIHEYNGRDFFIPPRVLR